MANIIEITDFAAPELDIYARLSEVQLLRYREPERGIFIAESPKVIGRALDAGYEPISFLAEQGQVEGEAKAVLARCPDVAVYTARSEVLAKLTGYKLTRGLLCAMNRRVLLSVEQVCAEARRIAVLENVVNPTNVGAIFRSAAALHMDAVLLTEGCSDPLYRRAARVSMGTVFQIPWTYINEKTMRKLGEMRNGGQSVQKDGAMNGLEYVAIHCKGKSSQVPESWTAHLHSLGFQTAAMALNEDSIGIDDPCLASIEKLAVVLGTEGDGLAAQTIADCDYTVKIPMSHGVDSLNVAAASAVAFWQLGRK